MQRLPVLALWLLGAVLPAMAAPPGPGARASMAALGMQPAQVEYLANDAPFVVFDVSPRSLSAEDAARGVSQVSLSYVAVDALSRVEVSTFTRSGAAGEVQVHGLPVRIDCGGGIAGYRRCTVPAIGADARASGDLHFGLRVEAEGLDGERSVVLVMLPVQRPAPPPARRAATTPRRAP
ncbi:MAG: hypothetical protein REJ24_19145 [Rhodocyclaceae bacterium]|nr:hypothetical protein [Pseudomonadota bacterium]MDQ7974703.1 hypothetical protein [Rhodocyclaceae bacterium]MDQ8002352.1 hypothetical protein [Pseudomonadota bacterium]